MDRKLTPKQRRVLVELFNGPRRLACLAEAVRISPKFLERTLEVLNEKGLVRQFEDRFEVLNAGCHAVGPQLGQIVVIVHDDGQMAFPHISRLEGGMVLAGGSWFLVKNGKGLGSMARLFWLPFLVRDHMRKASLPWLKEKIGQPLDSNRFDVASKAAHRLGLPDVFFPSIVRGFFPEKWPCFVR